MDRQIKRFLVLGSQGLIGFEVVALLKHNGHEVYAVDVHGKTNNYYLNISNSSEREVSSFLKSIDYLNFDGIVDCSYYKPVHWGKKVQDLSEREWELSLKAISNNLTKIFIPFVSSVTNSSKNLVLIGSIYGNLVYDSVLYDGTDMTPAPEYLVTKAGLLGLTRLLAQTGSGNNVLVNSISPGGIFNNQPSEFISKYCQRTLLGRMANPIEIARLIEFFLTANTYITGQNILIDGGYSVK